MPKFKTSFSVDSRPSSPCYSSIVHNWEQVVGPDGSKYLLYDEVNDRDFQPEIESYRQDTDIYALFARFQHGDLTALNQVERVYGDDTNVTDLNTMHNNLYNQFLTMMKDDDFKSFVASYKGDLNDYQTMLNDYTEIVNKKSQSASPVVTDKDNPPVKIDVKKESNLKDE